MRQDVVTKKAFEASESSAHLASQQSNGHSADAVEKLRVFIAELINEVDSLDKTAGPLSRLGQLEGHNSIDFYDEVFRFEIALIKSALRRTKGNQLHAARLLRLHPSTLHTKIKQFQINQFPSDPAFRFK
jgi:DNA-binding protein Fis